ncbi:hypothetical protein [Trinickia mobilis]|uniref:hypothetical protein n=1 Tax=Trinickia mobilis TaxID=2816356 RepID=UPI001A8FA6F0|nr:hypothetical protein [Trinickia mobilis]
MDLRKLVYQNVACGVPPEKVARDLGISEEHAKDMFDEVGLKLAGHQVFEAMPYLACQKPIDALQNRKTLLPILETLDLDAPALAKLVRVRTAQTKQV